MSWLKDAINSFKTSEISKATSSNSSVINTILDNQLRIIATQFSIIDILEKNRVIQKGSFESTMNEMMKSPQILAIKESFENLKTDPDFLDDEMLDLLESLEMEE